MEIAMVRAASIVFAMLLAFLVSPAVAQVDCGPNPKDVPPDVQQTLSGDVEGKAQLFTKLLGDANLKGTVATSRNEIYQKFNNIDKSQIDRYMIWVSCQTIMGDKTLDTPRKIQLWISIYKELNAKPQGSSDDNSASCKAKGDCSKLVDYDGPPLSIAPERLASQYPSVKWTTSPTGDRLFQYSTELQGYPSTLSFWQPNGALKFKWASLMVSSSFSDFQTTVPTNSPYYPAAFMRQGNSAEVKAICEDVWDKLLAKLEDRIGPVLDKPIVRYNDISQPPGCQIQNNCWQLGKEQSTEIRFVNFDNIVLKKAGVSQSSEHGDGLGHSTAVQSGNCGISLIVNDPASLSQ
jgi:hypothetical protein